MSKELKIKGVLDKDFKQVYIDDEPTNLFITEEGKIKTATIKQTVDGNEVEISGNKLIAPRDLQLKYDNDNRIDLTVASDGHLQITGTGSDDDFTMDFDGAVVIDSLADDFSFKDNGTKRFSYSSNTFIVYGTSGSASEFFSIATTAEGATTLGTNDLGGDAAHLTVDIIAPSCSSL